MAHSGNPNPVPKLYKSIIEDVIEGVSELFAEEGVDEQVLKELKRLWETKVMQSKATEGFFRDHCSVPQFVLQLPQHLHQSLHTSAVLQGNRNISNFAGTDMNSSGSSSSFTLPHGITYPIHLPAGMTVQTASGQLYKVTVPVMVTQAPGAPRILQQPIQQYFQHISRPPRPATSTQLGGDIQGGLKWQQQHPQQQHVAQANRFTEVASTLEGENTLDNNFGKANGEPFIQQTVDMQKQQVVSNLPNQPLNGLKENNCNDMPPLLFSPKQTELTLADNSESLLNNLNMAQTVQGQSGNECLLKSQVADNVVELILLGDEDDNANKNIPLDNAVNLPDKVSTMENLLSPGGIDIIQLDGTGDTSSDEELGTVRDVDENEFLGIIDTEDLKALEEEDSGSHDSTSSSSDDEDPEIDIIEEDPLNSGDDVSEQEVPDLFDTDNVIVCQYDKIHRSKNKWKFYLKDGVMCFGGKDYIFSKAIGEAEW